MVQMNKYQKEVEKIKLDLEKQTLDRLQKTYVQATKDVKKEIRRLDKEIQALIDADIENKTMIRSKIYQLQYQTAMLENLKDTFKVLSDENVDNVGKFLNKMYEISYLGQIYNLHKQDIPVYLPLNHKKLVKAVYKDIEGMKFSKRLYKDVDKVKKEVISEISRGIASGFTVDEISVNIADRLGVSMRKAYQIARTEGGRVSTESTYDSIKDSISKGADLVKVWDSTLDKKTRPHHRELDGQYAEVDEPFKYSGGEVKAPHMFGIASEDINCRCALLSSPRWDVEEEYTKRDNITGETIKAKNYFDWEKKYLVKIDELTRGEIKKATKVDKVYLKTKEYKEKFDGVGSVKASKEVRICTKRNILKNDKTQNESYSFINNENGEHIFTADVGKLGGKVDISAINGYHDVTLTHNHPYSSSFSIDDLELILSSDKITTIVAGGHNGTIYLLSAPKSDIMNLRKEYGVLYDEYDRDAHLVMLELAKKYGWTYERR